MGAFSKENNADSFRAQALLEGYLSADIFVESSVNVHRVMIGPFAQKHEAELAIDWASGKKFSGLLLARSD
ncbi:MAG: SPOR domain-containing protein [Pseudomonadales bacterium]